MTWLAQSPTGVPLLDAAEVTALHNATVAKMEQVRALLGTLDGRVDGLETIGGTTNTTLATIQGLIDGLESLVAAGNTTQASILTEVQKSDPAAVTSTQFPSSIGPKAAANSFSIVESTGSTLANQAKQDEATAAIRLVGTRGYGTPLTRFAYATSTGNATAAISAAEILLHNTGAGRCYFALGLAPAASVNDFPLEPGEKFHMRITPGHKLNAIQDPSGGVAGNLNIIPVA